MPDSSVLPTTTMASTGTAAAGTLANGPWEGPLTILESGLTFLRLGSALTLKDAVWSTAAGAALAQQHALAISVGQMNNVIGFLFSNAARPDTAMRTVPSFNLPTGKDIFFRAVQLSAGLEASTVVLFWSKAKA